MTDTYASLMKGIIAALLANASVAALVGTRVYSNAPQNATFPYVVVEINSSPYAGKDFSGMEHTVIVRGFSSKAVPKEAADIAAAAYAVLDRTETNFTLDSGTINNIHYNGIGFVAREPDGVIWQSMRQFRCVVT